MVTQATSQILTQIYGVCVTLLYTAVVTCLLLLVVKRTLSLRVTPEEEHEGLDISLHGKTVRYR